MTSLLNQYFTKSELCLAVSAIAFSFSFVGQRAAMIGGIGPMTFNSIRYIFSGALLLTVAPLLPPSTKVKTDKPTPLAIGRSSADGALEIENLLPDLSTSMPPYSPLSDRALLWAFGVTLGLLNFIASTAQQIGLQYTSAGKCAFITGFDVVFVPVLGLMIPHLTSDTTPKVSTWLAVGLCVVGLYFLSSSETKDSDTIFGKGELFVFIGTVFWTLHIVVTDIATNHVDPIALTLIQFLSTSIFCTGASVGLEFGEWSVGHILSSWKVIVLLGVCECIGLTMAAMGQTHTPPSHAAIIMSFEAIFTAIIGYIFLDEILTAREFFGCLLMVVSFLGIRWDMQVCEFLSSRCTHRIFSRSLFMDRIPQSDITRRS